MRLDEQIHKFELVAADVKKGDQIALVGPWNFFRGSIRDRAEEDVYGISYWTVAAIGKKVMRLVNTKTDETAKHVVYINPSRFNESGNKVTGFWEFVARPERALALAGVLHSTDKYHTQTMSIVYPEKKYR